MKEGGIRGAGRGSFVSMSLKDASRFATAFSILWYVGGMKGAPSCVFVDVSGLSSVGAGGGDGNGGMCAVFIPSNIQAASFH